MYRTGNCARRIAICVAGCIDAEVRRRERKGFVDGGGSKGAGGAMPRPLPHVCPHDHEHAEGHVDDAHASGIN